MFNEFIKRYCFMTRCFAIVIAYFATGKLGLFLAIPPGYATAIYPPSGIALTGILILGYRAWWGVLLGSFLMNLSIAASRAPIDSYIPVVVALVIAIGATAQAVSGAYLIKRFADFPNPLASEKSVFKFMFFGGMLSTLLNSTISVSTLVVMNLVPLSNFFMNWSTWWMGDAIGIFIFSPLTLVWFYQKHDYFRHRKQVITTTMLAAFSLTIMLVTLEIHEETEHLKIEFEKDSQTLSIALNNSITAHLTVLRSLESFYTASHRVERKEFHTFVFQFLKDFKSIQALEWCPIIKHSQREAFEKSVQKEGFSNFEIKERDENKKLIRANKREFYTPVTFLEPFKGNELALGYDLNTKERREALENARDTGEITTSSKITLVQDNQAGILVIAPIYKNNFPHQTLQERRQNILGYTQVVFHIDDILNIALTNYHFEKLHLQLFDENAPAQRRVLFCNQLTPFELHEKGLFGRNISLISSLPISMGNRQWRFEITPTQDYFAYHCSNNAWLILLTGLVLTSMVGIFIMVSSGREMVLEQLVKERTGNLIEIDVELKRSNAELEQFAYAVSHDMRQPLRMVSNYLSLIEKALKTQLDEEMLQFLTFAINGAKRMDSMILSLLDYSKFGKQIEHLAVISTREAVNEALLFLKPTIEISEGKVDVLGDWINLVADRDGLTRLLQNLIGNALKYHEESKPPVVKVSASMTATNCFRVEVQDSGIGINQSQMARLFKVFSRLQTHNRFEGTGVGLALCRKIVECHGGKIGVNSAGEGHGCIFWFEIPIATQRSTFKS